jgi:NADH dehydrogenase (ubiquinone) Fe-S protein 3
MHIKAKTSFENIVPLLSFSTNNKENIVFVSHFNLKVLLNCFRNHLNYKYTLLSCISGIDYLKNKYRFGISYDLLSIVYNSRLRVKVFVNEITSVDSICSIYVNANWWEREIWDLYGIYFDEHPDLRRILTDYGFEGYPMRKDFPLSGYIELKYDHKKKRIVLEALELSQEFRSFAYQTPW